MGYGYDANASRASLAYPTGLTVTYSPNALGQPTQVASTTQTFASGITYYANGALAGFTYGNGIVHTLTQNARGLPDRSQDMDGSTAVHDDSYDYDAVGNVLGISDAVTGNRGDRDMVYDDLNRLSSATSPMFGTASYSYDVQDNLRHVAVTGGPQARDQDYCYDAANRLTNVMTGGCSGGTTVVGLGYDVQGNLANKSGVTYGFDYGNRMRSGGPESYRYDAYGRRVRSMDASTHPIYSLYGQDGTLLWQRDERTNERRNYVYLSGSLLAEHRRPIGSTTETIIYQHTDALGSPVVTTSATKAVGPRREYEPYGYQLTPTLTDGPGYTGHVTDAATGLVYMQQRYYDPLCGCFLSTDPVTALGGSFNRYWYANDDPYGMVDPDGRGAIKWFVKVVKEITTKEGKKITSESLRRLPTEKAAVRAREAGKNVHVEGTSRRAPTSSAARRVEEKATGKSNTMREDAHGNGDRENSSDTNPHYQPEVRGKGSEGWGHTTYRLLGYGTAVGTLPPDASSFDRGASEVVDFFNPISDVQDVVGLFTGDGQE